MKTVLLFIHRWLGLVAGVFLLAIGMSGSLLVYRQPIDRVLHPSLYDMHEEGPRLTFDSLYSIIFQKYGLAFASFSFDIPSREQRPIDIILTKSNEHYYQKTHYLVTINPYTGAILREGNCADISTSFVHWVMYFHDSFQLGRAGILAAALCAIVMFGSILTGVAYYGKRITGVLRFRLSLTRTRGTQFYRSAHVYVALWSILFTTIVFLTGFWMVKGILEPGSWKISEEATRMRLATSIDSCIQRSTAILPGFIPDFIEIPFIDGQPIGIDGSIGSDAFFPGGDASRVEIDPRNGTAIGFVDERTNSFPGNISSAFWALHVGNYGGSIVKLIYAIGGLLPGVLANTGFVMWKGGKKDRKID